MIENTSLKNIRPAPTIVKDDQTGKERTSTGRWSLPTIAQHVAENPGTMFTCQALARLGYLSAIPKHVMLARRNIRAIANLLEERGTAVVVEFSGRKLHAIQVYIPANEYHQKLMADEIGRRKLRRDGSAEKLELLLKSLPTPTVTEADYSA